VINIFKNYIITGLFVVVIVLSIMAKCNSDRIDSYNRQINEIAQEKEQLSKEQEKLFKAKENLQALITIKEGEIETLRRIKGKLDTLTIYKDTEYIPIEGSVIIEIEGQKDTTGKDTTKIHIPIVTIRIKNKGLCLKPKISYDVVYPSISLGARWAFYNAWGSFICAGRDLESWDDYLQKDKFYLGLGADYRLWRLKIPNTSTEFGVNIYPFRADKWQIRLAIGIFL